MHRIVSGFDVRRKFDAGRAAASRVRCCHVPAPKMQSRVTPVIRKARFARLLSISSSLDPLAAVRANGGRIEREGKVATSNRLRRVAERIKVPELSSSNTPSDTSELPEEIRRCQSIKAFQRVVKGVKGTEVFTFSLAAVHRAVAFPSSDGSPRPLFDAIWKSLPSQITKLSSVETVALLHAAAKQQLSPPPKQNQLLRSHLSRTIAAEISDGYEIFTRASLCRLPAYCSSSIRAESGSEGDVAVRSAWALASTGIPCAAAFEQVILYFSGSDGRFVNSLEPSLQVTLLWSLAYSKLTPRQSPVVGTILRAIASHISQATLPQPSSAGLLSLDQYVAAVWGGAMLGMAEPALTQHVFEHPDVLADGQQSALSPNARQQVREYCS